MGFFQRITGFTANREVDITREIVPAERASSEPRTAIREIIGRATTLATSFVGNFYARLRIGVSSVDTTQMDYEFWDNFRRGKAKGLEIAGLLAQPILQIIASWVLGEGIKAMLVASADDPDNDEDPINYTNTLLARFMTRMKSRLANMLLDLYGLGDQYFIVNIDGTISIPSPETVDVEYEELDYRTPIKYTIVTKFKKALVTDEYREDGRTVLIKRDGEKEPERFDFPNLIGKIPVVHWANNRGTNETHGRVIYEALYRMFTRYDNLILKMLDGAELMGNPFPVMENLDDPEETEQKNATGTETYTDDDGIKYTRPIIDFSRLTVLLLGKGGVFKFASPQKGFTDDIRSTLKSLYLLMMEHIRIPDVVWGFELSSARATAGEQMKTFYSFIWHKRLQIEGMGADELLEMEASDGLHALIDIWLRTKRLTDPKIVVGPVSFQWSPLAEANDQLNFEKAKDAHTRGVITDETYLEEIDLRTVEDPAQEVEDARVQAEERTPDALKFDDEVDRLLNEDDEEEDVPEDEIETEAA